MENEDREKLKELVRTSSWNEGVPCEACNGEGKVPGGRQLIHSFRGGFGADRDLESALAAIDTATEVIQRQSMFGPQVAIRTPEGSFVAFDVLHLLEKEEEKP
jgi:hypothetical protein